MPKATRLATCLIVALASLGPAGAHAAGDTVSRLQAVIATETARYGPASPRLLSRYDELARLSFRKGRLGATTTARQNRLTITIHAYGFDLPRTAEAMTAMAQAELDQLRYLDAEPLFIAALNATPPGPAQAAALAGLSRVALARGEPGEALSDADRAAALQPRSTEALRALGAAYAADHRFDDAERVLNQAIALDRARDDKNVETARSLSQLGNLYLHADRLADALPPLEEAASLDRVRLDPDHPFVADDLHDLAIAEEGLQRPELALRMLDQALEILRRGGDEKSTRVAYCNLELARIERAVGETEQADIDYRRGQDLLNAAEDADHDREKRI